MMVKHVVKFLLFGCSLIITSCGNSSSINDTCLESPSEPQCISIISQYSDLRNSSNLFEGSDDDIVSNLKQLSRQFSIISMKTKELSPCIHLSSKSYAQYLMALVLGFEGRKELGDTYPINTSNISDNIMEHNCSWDIGESSIILADYTLSERYKVSGIDEFRKLVFMLNKTHLDDHLACIMMFRHLQRAERSKKFSKQFEIIEWLSSECNYKADKKYGNMSSSKAKIIFNENFSLLDRTFSGEID